MISLAPDHDVPLRSSGLNLGTTCRRFNPMDVELRLDFIYLFIVEHWPEQYSTMSTATPME
jgi:hypothetical protein